MHTHWGGPLVKLLSLMALLLFHGCTYRLNWVSFALAKQQVYTKLSSSILHGILYPSIKNGQFFTWYQVWALLDSGVSYPFGPFLKVPHHSGWCTASYVAPRSCFTSSSSVHKTPWDYPKTDVHFRRYSVDKRSSEPCLANCQAVFSWQIPETCSHIFECNGISYGNFDLDAHLITPFMWTVAFIQYSPGW